MSAIDLPIAALPPAPVLPRTLVVRLGYMRHLGEFPYGGDVRPLCGSKVVVRTRRGTELAEVLTTTCADTGCARSVSPQKMADYIASSGGADYPFTTEGRVLRVASEEDIAQQRHLDAHRYEYVRAGKEMIAELQLPMRLIEVELILGGEMATFYFGSEVRVDFRILVKQLAARFHTRIQMHQIGARDEARVAADYETCGQQCCCRQFLKVLRPINMGHAKMQKATLDPSKISGRCGRLKCCLRYEEQTYDELRRRLPRTGLRVRVQEGVGVVVETMILTQLVKVRLDDDRLVAVANDEILERDVAASAQPAPPRVSSGPVNAAQAAGDRPPPRRRPIEERMAADADDGAEMEGEADNDAAGPRDRGDGPQQAPGSAPPGGMGALGRRRRRRRDRPGGGM